MYPNFHFSIDTGFSSNIKHNYKSNRPFRNTLNTFLTAFRYVKVIKSVYWSGPFDIIFRMCASLKRKQSSFWRNFRHWLFRQLSVQPGTNVSPKWQHFRFSVPIECGLKLSHCYTMALFSVVCARFTPNRDQLRTDLRVENFWISWTRVQSSNFYRQITS